MLGNNIDGGYAEFVVAPAKDAFVLPAGVPLVEGCVLADAVTTPYHAVVRRARVVPGRLGGGARLRRRRTQHRADRRRPPARA